MALPMAMSDLKSWSFLVDCGLRGPGCPSDSPLAGSMCHAGQLRPSSQVPIFGPESELPRVLKPRPRNEGLQVLIGRFFYLRWPCTAATSSATVTMRQRSHPAPLLDQPLRVPLPLMHLAPSTSMQAEDAAMPDAHGSHQSAASQPGKSCARS